MSTNSQSQAIEVAAYYFPNYHADSRNEKLHGAGWNEWDLMKRAEVRFPGHEQPKVPAWGYDDESDPERMALRIDAAANHGIDAFIFDWYYYDDGPFLQRALEDGFMKAPNNDRMRFALMWANHSWIDIHPAKTSIKSPEESAQLLYPGTVTEQTFDRITEQCVNVYFRHPSYWCRDGRPYFSVYELTKLMASFGSKENTRRCLKRFRDAVRAAGFPDLHLNAIVWNNPILPGEQTAADPYTLVQELGFDSVSSYTWIHHATLNQFPLTDFQSIEQQYMEYWEKAQSESKLPYYPNLSMGWDPSPRTVQSDRYLQRGYPFTPIIGGNTPEAFRTSAAKIREKLESYNPPHPFMTINAWNEWTEGSYLEPDTRHGMGYLEAIRDVFCQRKQPLPL